MEIHDTRTILDFQKFTFSGHLRQHVYKVLDENIKLGHADYSCFWVLELLCSGLVHSAWQTLFESAARHINRGAPNVFLYLVRSYETFSPYESQYDTLNMTEIRNNKEVQNLFCQVAASLALCRKNKLPAVPKIKPEHDFNQLTIKENLKAPSSNYARHLIKGRDVVELYIPLNEIVFLLRPETRDISKTLYWISWMLKYASFNKKHNKKEISCAIRQNDYIESKHQTHIIWLIWDAILDAAKTSPQSVILHNYIQSLFKIHCLRWTPSLLKTRLCFVVVAIQYICESTTLDVHYAVPNNISVVQDVTQNIPQWISAIIETKKTFV